MEAQPFFVGFGWVAIAFGIVLLLLPSLQVLRGAQPAKRVVGLLVSGVGFLLFGLGLAFAHSGLAATVLPGITLTAVGHLWQRWATKPLESA